MSADSAEAAEAERPLKGATVDLALLNEGGSLISSAASSLTVKSLSAGNPSSFR